MSFHSQKAAIDVCSIIDVIILVVYNLYVKNKFDAVSLTCCDEIGPSFIV